MRRFQSGMFTEKELVQPVNLCDERGRLNREAVGWSRRPLHTCNLKGHLWRKKRWNYWCVTTDRFLFSATISDIDYLGLAFVYFLDFESGFFHELTVARPFARGCALPDTVGGTVRFNDARLVLEFAGSSNKVLLGAACSDFGGRRLAADLTVSIPPDHETLNVVIPWSDRRFQFTSKQNTLPVTGTVTVGRQDYDAAGGFACLDFGRGVWPYSSFWNWAAASGVSHGRIIGLNFGAGWTDGTGLNENGICIDGRLTKISEDLVFTYNTVDFKQPWTIRTASSERVAVTFMPFFERVAKTDLFVLRSEVHQLIGRFSGTVVDEAGKAHAFTNLVGWAEEHRARW